MATIREKHPSFGSAILSRCTGSQRLVGSMLDLCPGYMALRIYHADRHVDDQTHHEYYFHEGAPLIEVLFSTHQFAELIMGVGRHVECTLAYVNGEMVAQPPGETPLERIQKDARKTTLNSLVDGEADFNKDVDALLAEVDELKISQKAATALRNKIRGLKRHVSAPVAAAGWASEMLARTGEKVVAQAKMEIDAAKTAMVTRLGLEALATRVEEQRDFGLPSERHFLPQGQDDGE